MTTYYLSSKSGNDLNNGTSATQAWSSFSKLSGKLKAGDTVLLEKGSEFEQTLTLSKVNGTKDLPVTISSYGTGENPILGADTDKGIYSQFSNYIVLRDITIQGTGSSGIYATQSSNWVIQNVVFDNTALKNGAGSINWINSNNVLIENSTVINSHGDGIFMNNVNNVIIKDNIFKDVTGSNADNIQIIGHDAVISGNILQVSETSDTTKGNIVFHGENLYAHDNYLEGGSFGMSISADNVVIENNTIKGHDKYTWSSDILLSDEATGDLAENIVIKNNTMSDSNRNISIDGQHSTAANMEVKNLTISGNEFHDWSKAPLAINGANITGVFENNTTDKNGSFLYATNSNLGGLFSQGNAYAPDQLVLPPPPPPKTITVVASGSLYQGIAPIMKLYVNGIEIAQQSVTALKANGEKQTVTFTIPNFYQGDKFEIKYTNDQSNTKTDEDRNLYVHSVSMDGAAIALKSADVTSKILFQKDGSGMFFSSNATATFTSDDVPQSVLSKVVFADTSNVPHLENILESDHNNIFYGGENHVFGATADTTSTYGASFKDITGGLDELHKSLLDHFG